LGRSLAREKAMQALFANEQGQIDALQVLEYLAKEVNFSEEEICFARMLTEGTLSHLPFIDETIQKHLHNWEIERLSAVDRSILRLSSFELIFYPDTPPAVVINEAVELAKKFGETSGAAFVNGVLDSIFLTRGRKDQEENA